MRPLSFHMVLILFFCLWFLLLSTILRLAEAVFSGCCSDQSLWTIRFSTPISMSLVGAALSADIMLTTSIDLELALQQALAVLPGGQEVRGSHSRVDPLALPFGGIVHCVMSVPTSTRLRKAILDMPQAHFVTLRPNLLQVFLTCSTYM